MQKIKIFYNNYFFKNILNPFLLILIIRFEQAVEKGALLNILKLVKKINRYDTDIAKYCLSKICFLKAKYNFAIAISEYLISKYPKHIEAHYLLSKCHYSNGNIRMAQLALYNLLKISKRKKSWLLLSNLVCNKNDFLYYKKHFDTIIMPINHISNIEFLKYYSEAAIRAKEYSEAISIWKYGLRLLEAKKWLIKKTNKTFSINKAAKALIDLRHVFDINEISFFLISGTLLGYIRDGSILPHDKDLDVGVWETASYQKILKCIQKSGFFEILPVISTKQIKIKHVNGIKIDILYHICELDYVWHATSKIRWINSHFKLKKIFFLEAEFYIPDNPEKYLVENYGDDWMTPKLLFDSAIDTPNAEIINQEEMNIYCYKKIFEIFLGGYITPDLLIKYHKKIVEN